ncbi:hypothetical protein BMS3Abin16_00561 [archaeon BMS3Abin16]|nr:hypothetical protein BMS3Abin16_00561 [archaeon BMS3Abin16]
MTTKELKMFEPSTFPIASSGRPSLAAVTLTISSGSEVPRATALAAIISLPILNSSESVIIDSTVYFAPR